MQPQHLNADKGCELLPKERGALLRRVLSFIGWSIAVFFFLIGVFGFTTNPAIATTFLIWGLIFLPPLYRLTNRYGLGWNIGGRAIAFFLSIVIAGFSAPPQQAVRPTAQPTPSASISTATPNPMPLETIKPAPAVNESPVAPKPVIKPEPTVIENPAAPKSTTRTKPEPPQLEPAPNTSTNSNVDSATQPELTPTEVPAPQLDPSTPARGAVSGSCQCPYDTDRRGRSCGGRSAYSKPGGEKPVCYVGDRQ